MPTPLAGGLENSFAPQMIFLWPPARGVGKLPVETLFGRIPFEQHLCYIGSSLTPYEWI